MKQYVVDAFTDKVFSGNPAAVCVLDEPISEELMMNITKENNLSETAFAVKKATHMTCGGSRREVKLICAVMPLWERRLS